ncbi:ACP S-malonyltransferase [Clostridium estertheticum]|uniref:ACP S-malonyltransferase n=1 Tax=Clostridium estertheticum TaxID=238834 RepID=UPI001CF21445|nr:ACP S-malonyltransferase [Clostridium estertheticum]MCB2360138.1 ACP S-malonyltransferase [Clostridium estertheticum]
MSTYVFPGQGSQVKGMGGKLFDEFRELTEKANRVLGYSIEELCLEDPNFNLNKTQYTQPAMFIVNALSYLKKVKEVGKKPDIVAGHSLGEYNALFAAGAFDFETGLKLVKKRGELMSQAIDGGMAAIVGLDEKSIIEILQNNNLSSIYIANYNSPSQIVISGAKDDIYRAKEVFENYEGVRLFSILKVSGAFHSKFMNETKKEFEIFLDSIEFQPLTIPVISNVYARPYEQFNVKKTLAKQINHTVKWNESICYLMGKGEMTFEEVGVGRVLTSLVQWIKTEATPLIIDEDESTKDAFKTLKFQHVNNIPIDSSREFNCITADVLGSKEFKKDYNLKYAYLTGGMYRGIASKEMVVRMGKAGMMGFFGSGGLDLIKIEESLKYIQRELPSGQPYGINFVHNPNDLDVEEKIIDLLLRHEIRNIETAAFLSVTPALVKYHAKGLRMDEDGKVISKNKIIAKVSRPEVAEAFLGMAPERMISKLLSENKITELEAKLSREISVADDICVEADSGGHTDGGVAYSLMPAMIKLRDKKMEEYGWSRKVRIGAAGGIGTPEAAAAAFILGADFILTGSVNQCTVEAQTSDAAKDLLQQMNVQDTEYVPAGDMFQLGAKVQVLKKGLFFPARANKLYDLYRNYDSLDDIDEKTKLQIQDKYFKRSFEKVYEDVKAYYPSHEIEKAELNPKHKMSLIFRWYFGYSTQLALSGSDTNKVDYQIPCGPALGAFNQWVKGTELEDWRNRHVEDIGKRIIEGAAELLNTRFNDIRDNK